MSEDVRVSYARRMVRLIRDSATNPDLKEATAIAADRKESLTIIGG